MATRKRNEWLDAEESDGDEKGYDSEDESRARMLQSSKRQKVTHDSADEDVEEDGDEVSDHEDDAELDEDAEEDNENDITDPAKLAEINRLESLAASIPSHLQPPTALSGTLSIKPKKDRSGIIYLSRIPPFMKPTVLRSLLTPYGALGRIFLTPEPHAQRTSRLKNGGTRRKLFLDGWVEFLSKKDAKFVAENLNAEIMGGKKRGRWHDEVWNIRYLKGVKWSHLVEQVKNENAERAARLRSEISQSKKDNTRFLENVERGKMVKGIQEKRKKQAEAREEDGAEAAGGSERANRVERDARPRREFKQVEVVRKGIKKDEGGEDVQRVLSKIF
ncbi:hypothetical protein P154DRAFT_527330 [Amniculicola lignicola CBS 123094]|uniref:18S rRNA factor 2 n=1 Tax=Amniculicola lignicola CBS 123094 TaxID=1392246 RepID=A0A6A5W4K5_9PLEO|nr:hypothetical protein P154DRAFT_527330 [Amniculicola lignicola CBS 123094]